MPHLFSQHSVHCLVCHIHPVIHFKLIMLRAHAHALMVHNRFHQFCSTMKGQEQITATFTILQGTPVLDMQQNMAH